MDTSTRPDTRTHLVKTASELFQSRSYGNISTSKICEAAAVNKGTFYHFFPSKAALLIAAMNGYTQDQIAVYNQIAGSEQTPEAKIIALFTHASDTSAACKESHGVIHGCMVANIGMELSTVDATITKATRENLAALCQALEPIVSAFAEERGLSLDTVTEARQLMGILQGAVLMAKIANDASGISAMAASALATLCR